MRLLFVLALISFVARADDGSGLRISAAVDTVAHGNIGSGNSEQTNIMVRGAEVSLFAPADHLFDGTLSVAAHGNEPDVGVELHEGWIGSSKLIPRSRFRLGQFFLGVGRLNQFHQHDWPFISAPRVHTEFFAFEGVFDTGADYTYLLPLPFFLELTVGITNGYVFGHSHNRAAARPPQIATSYARLVTYTPLPSDGGAQIGISALTNRSNQGLGLALFGLDLTAKWKELRRTLFLFQSEFWYRQRTPSGAASEDAFGFYLYPEYLFAENFFIGLRLDYYSLLNLKDALGLTVASSEWNVVPTLSYKPSEFVVFRLAYNHRPSSHALNGNRVEKFIEFQSMFILGAHPAHDF